MGRDVPRLLRTPAAAGGTAHRPVARLRHLRRRGSAQRRPAGHERAGPRPEDRAAQGPAVAHQPGEEPPRERRRPAAGGTELDRDAAEGAGNAAAEGRVRVSSRGLRRRAARGGLQAVRASAARQPGARLRRSAPGDGAAVQGVGGSAHPVRRALPLRHGGRVPGHEPAAVPAGALSGRAAPQPLRGRRPRPVHLQVARRGPAQHPRLRKGLPRDDGRTPGAQLPVHAGHPGRGVGAHRPQPAAPGEAALHGERRRRADRLPSRQRRYRGGRLHPRPTPPRGRRRAGGGALPHQRAVAGDRGGAGARGHPLPRGRRGPLLRAAGDQGRAGVPEAAAESRRRREPAPRHQRPGARGRRGRDGGAGRRRAAARARRAAVRRPARDGARGGLVAVEAAAARDRGAAAPHSSPDRAVEVPDAARVGCRRPSRRRRSPRRSRRSSPRAATSRRCARTAARRPRAGCPT